jgi:hypothetical protein
MILNLKYTLFLEKIGRNEFNISIQRMGESNMLIEGLYDRFKGTLVSE